MRTSGCPKCHGRRLLHVTEVADRIGDAGGAHIDDGREPRPETGFYYPWRLARIRNRTGGFSQVQGAGHVEAYVCRSCGFTEFYTKDAGDIPIDGDLIKEVVLPGTPFR